MKESKNIKVVCKETQKKVVDYATKVLQTNVTAFMPRQMTEPMATKGCLGSFCIVLDDVAPVMRKKLMMWVTLWKSGVSVRPEYVFDVETVARMYKTLVQYYSIVLNHVKAEGEVKAEAPKTEAKATGTEAKAAVKATAKKEPAKAATVAKAKAPAKAKATKAKAKETINA